MIIHFVCRGNAYRSRLAEAYLGSKRIANIISTSSGIEGELGKKLNGPIAWYAARIVQYYSLVPFMSLNPKQTSKGLLDDSNLVIFFDRKYLQNCQKKFDFKGPYELWEIPDVDDYGLTKDNQTKEDDLKKMEISQKTFDEIKKRIDDLITRIEKLN